MTAALIEARRAALLGLAESPRVIDIILHVAEGVLEGEVASEAVSSLVFDPARTSADGQQFAEAIDSLRKRRPEIASGSSRAVRAAADSLELLELQTEFLRDAAEAMGESSALAAIAARLRRNLDALDGGSEAILRAFVPLCRRYAAQNATDEEDQDDLFQIGFFGLRRAVVRFKPELGTQFAAYASAWLRQSVTRWRADEGRLIRLPVHRQQWLAECRRAADAIELGLQRDATPDEIAVELRAVFAHRGRVVPSMNTRTGGMPDLWDTVKNRKGTSYRISREHDLVASLLDRAGPLRADILAALRMIEETVPVQRIWLDTAEDRETPATGFAAAAPEEVRAPLTALFRALVQHSHLTEEEARERLLRTHPFERYPALVAELTLKEL